MALLVCRWWRRYLKRCRCAYGDVRRKRRAHVISALTVSALPCMMIAERGATGVLKRFFEAVIKVEKIKMKGRDLWTSVYARQCRIKDLLSLRFCKV